MNGILSRAKAPHAISERHRSITQASAQEDEEEEEEEDEE